MRNLILPWNGVGSARIEEFKLAESQQILPLIGNRKPASDRGHWLQPAPCARPAAGRALVGNGETGSSVPADPTRHGHRNRQEDRRVRLLNRVDLETASRAIHTLSRN